VVPTPGSNHIKTLLIIKRCCRILTFRELRAYNLITFIFLMLKKISPTSSIGIKSMCGADSRLYSLIDLAYHKEIPQDLNI
jgi:hypothetical protein